MKISIIFAIVLAAALLTGQSEQSLAQSVHPAGYWVVETNDRTHHYTVVKFYDQADQLVYEERLEGVHLDVSRRKSRQLLNQTLSRVVNHNLLGSQLARKEASPEVAFAKKRASTDSW